MDSAVSLYGCDGSCCGRFKTSCSKDRRAGGSAAATDVKVVEVRKEGAGHVDGDMVWRPTAPVCRAGGELAYLCCPKAGSQSAAHRPSGARL